MQRALPGSLLVHLSIIGVGMVGFAWPDAGDAPAAEAVKVSIVTLSSVSANASAVLQSDATVNLVSSGEASSPAPVEPVQPDVVETLADPLQPLPSQEALQPLAEPVEASPIDSVASIEARQPEPAVPAVQTALLATTSVASLTAPPLAPAPPPSLDPVSSQDINAAPVPRTLSFERPSEPTTKPEPQPSRPAPPKVQSNPAGNGGNNNADAVAAASTPEPQTATSGSGGEAEVARYPGEVLRKLRRALRSVNGARGEVVVRFTVLASGQVSGVSIGRSSGNASIDQAGVATVNRAAPFPPIPTQIGRSSWTFDVPLAFGG